MELIFHITHSHTHTLTHTHSLSHNSGSTHWLDPRLTQYMKRDLLECNENGKQINFQHTHTHTYIHVHTYYNNIITV